MSGSVSDKDVILDQLVRELEDFTQECCIRHDEFFDEWDPKLKGYARKLLTSYAKQGTVKTFDKALLKVKDLIEYSCANWDRICQRLPITDEPNPRVFCKFGGGIRRMRKEDAAHQRDIERILEAAYGSDHDELDTLDDAHHAALDQLLEQGADLAEDVVVSENSSRLLISPCSQNTGTRLSGHVQWGSAARLLGDHVNRCEAQSPFPS